LQGVRRAAGGVHEELCRTSVQNRVSDVHKVLQKIRATELTRQRYLIAALAVGGAVAFDSGLGVIILLLMMATAFFGYTLPWGQMSNTSSTSSWFYLLLASSNARIPSRSA
jgi:hypothetical protein